MMTDLEARMLELMAMAREILAEMEELVGEARRGAAAAAAVDERNGEKKEEDAKPEENCRMEERKRRATGGKRKKPKVQAGCRVMVIVRDKYRGRVGTVMDRRGSMFWNVRLDEGKRGERVQTIYKMSSSLRVLE